MTKTDPKICLSRVSCGWPDKRNQVKCLCFRPGSCSKSREKSESKNEGSRYSRTPTYSKVKTTAAADPCILSVHPFEINFIQSKWSYFSLFFFFEGVQPSLKVVSSQSLHSIWRSQQIDDHPKEFLLALKVSTPPRLEDGVRDCEQGVGVGDVVEDYVVDWALEEESEIVSYNQDNRYVKTHYAVPEDGLGVLVRGDS